MPRDGAVCRTGAIHQDGSASRNYEVNLTYDAPYKNQLQVIFWVCVFFDARLGGTAGKAARGKRRGAKNENPWDSLRTRLKSGKSVRI